MYADFWAGAVHDTDLPPPSEAPGYQEAVGRLGQEDQTDRRTRRAATRAAQGSHRNVEPVIPRASQCFCGRGRRPEGSGQLASNLLGWEMNQQISELTQHAILVDALHPDRDPGQPGAFPQRDGRSYWLTLHSESHGEYLPTRESKKAAKRWVKHSKKMWKKSPGRGMMEVLDLPDSSAAEVGGWLLGGTRPGWAAEVEAEVQAARERD